VNPATSPFPRWLLVALTTGVAACSGANDDRADAGANLDAGVPVWVVEPGVPTQEDLLAVWGRAADDVYAVGFGGTVLHYDGVAWTRETTTSTQPLTAVHGLPLDPEALPTDPAPATVAVGWRGVILERGPTGQWSPAASTSTATDDLFGVALGDAESGLAVGDGGRVVGFDGTAWAEVPFAVPGEFSGEPIEPKGVLKGVWTGNGRRYYISGSGGAAYRSANGFETFEALDTRVSEPLRGIWGTANDNVYTVGLDSLILRFNGQWRRVSNEGADALPRAFLFGVWGRGGDDITLVGWRGTVIRRLGGAWFAEETGIEADLRGVWVDAETGLAFAVGASGTVLRRAPPPMVEPAP
jgi:hypothetical protein